MKGSLWTAAVTIALLSRGAAGAVTRDLTIELTGPGGEHHVATAAELRSLTVVDVDVASHNVHGHYRGALLGDVLRLLGRPAGDSLRGTALAQDVVVVRP
jgi:hypothetical protein